MYHPGIWTALFFLVYIPLGSLAQEPIDNGVDEKRVVCYFASWSWNRKDYGEFKPKDMNPYICTHIIYAFAGLNTTDNSIKPFNQTVDIDQGGYLAATGLKILNPRLKVLLSVGGWDEGVRNFSLIASDRQRRAEFADRALRMLRQYEFDGLDLAWQYPSAREGGTPNDKANFALWIQELSSAFKNESAVTGANRLLLSVVTIGIEEFIDRGFDVATLNTFADFVNMVAYDFTWDSDPVVSHHSPLFATIGQKEDVIASQFNIDASIKVLISKGIAPEKLNVGIPTYGRYHRLEDASKNWPGSPSMGGVKSNTTEQSGFIYYYEMCRNIKDGGWTIKNTDSDPYAFKDTNWVSFDTMDSVKRKATHARRLGLGGIMFWTIDGDDFHGTCHGRGFPLILAGGEALRGGSVAETNQKLTTPPVLVQSPVELTTPPVLVPSPVELTTTPVLVQLPAELSTATVAPQVTRQPKLSRPPFREAVTSAAGAPIISLMFGGSTFYQNITVNVHE